MLASGMAPITSMITSLERSCFERSGILLRRSDFCDLWRLACPLACFSHHVEDVSSYQKSQTGSELNLNVLRFSVLATLALPGFFFNASLVCEKSIVKLTCLTTVKGRMTSVLQDAT